MSPFFFASLALFFVWAGLFLFSKSTRREQAIMSLVGLVLSPGALLMAANDFRAGGEVSSLLGIEDVIFSFCLFGIASVAYHVALGKHTATLRGERYPVKNATHWFAHMLIILGIWSFIGLVTSLVFGLHTIQAFILGGVLIGTYIIADRKDLLLDALLSGAMVAMLIFIIEQVFFARLFPESATDFWQIQNLSGIMLGGVPIEETLWAAVVGFAIGPCYEYVRRYRLK